MSEPEPERSMRQRSIVQPPMILKPCRMGRVVVQVLRANMMVLALAHAPQAS